MAVMGPAICTYVPCSVQGQDALILTRHRTSKIGPLKLHSPELP